LLVAAIVLWNTMHLADAVERLKQQGQAISNEQLRHLSPLGWEHISLSGDYRWNMRLVSNRPVLSFSTKGYNAQDNYVYPALLSLGFVKV